MKQRLELTHQLMKSIGVSEEPMALYFSDDKPEAGFAPKEGMEISREMEDQGTLDPKLMRENFSCIMSHVWLARKKQSAAYISKKQYGCFGGSFYAGFQPRHLKFMEQYVSTGVEGSPIRGERFLPSPESTRAYMEGLAPEPARHTYCIFKPVSQIADGDGLVSVTFFGRMEALSCLAILATFTTGDVDVIASPFGSSCSSLISWPQYYKRNGRERAVLGTFDPSARKFLKTDEMFLTFPLALYDKMLLAMPESHLGYDIWEVVKKKIDKSNKTWGEAGAE